jgi:Glycosyl transferase family 2/Glycosyl transferases group 1
MRVNFIGTFGKTTGVSQDVSILHGLVAHVLDKDAKVRHIPHRLPSCPQAEVNFFIEVINPALFIYAAKNIWIPNPEWTYKTWEPYARMVDEIWVKTQEAAELFEKWVPAEKVKLVGWTSIDKEYPTLGSKDPKRGIVPVGKNVWRHPKPILQAYSRIFLQKPELYAKLPHLTIVHSPEHVPVGEIAEAIRSKVTVRSEVVPDEEYKQLLQTCGLVVCTSAAEGFGHAVNEALSTGCIPILSPIQPFREMVKNALWVSNAKTMEHPQCMGMLEDVDVDSLADAFIAYTKLTPEEHRTMTTESRECYEDRHEMFVKAMLSRLDRLFTGMPEYSLEEKLPKEEALPSVSVITITRDRRPFIPLAKYGFLAQTYPEHLLEWVIVDSGKDPIKNLITDLPNVTYVLVDEPGTVGEMRNLAVSKAKHDVLVMMDDDDVYPNNSVLTRVAHLLAEPRKECIFSTVLPCYEIHETKSFMNVPPITLSMSQRVSEATLCFTRKFWTDRPFPNAQIAEGDAFLHGREDMCRELSPQDVIVSLCHKKTTSSRKPPAGMEVNGSHYGFSDELFTLISEIALSL